MALRTEVVDLVWLRDLENPGEAVPVGEVPIVEAQVNVRVVGISVEVVDPTRVERGASTNDAVHLVALCKKELG
jgi:hypothetical protein